MPMQRAEVITSWVLADRPGMGAAYVPRVARDHALASWRDVTGQPAETILAGPHLLVVEAVAEPAVRDAIAADAACLLLPQAADDPLTENEQTELRAFLLAHGVEQRAVDDVLSDAAKESRNEVIDRLKQWLRG